MIAGGEVLDVAAPITTILMIAPPSEADGWRMGHAELQDFQTTSNLPWVFVQKCPRSQQYCVPRALLRAGAQSPVTLRSSSAGVLLEQDRGRPASAEA